MRRRRRPRVRKRRSPLGGAFVAGEIVELAERIALHSETSPRLTGGDLDADWESAGAAGDEAVGGSAATPDQDVVDELGRALGVEQADEAELQTSEELLRTRDRHRWRIEWESEHPAGGRRAEERR